MASAAPLIDGTVAVGTSTLTARQDHVHPTDTSRAPLASPTFTGTPAAPTANSGTNTTQLATTAFVTTAVAGKEASLGNPGTNGYVLSSTTAGGRSWIAAGGGSSLPTQTGNNGKVLRTDGTNASWGTAADSLTVIPTLGTYANTYGGAGSMGRTTVTTAAYNTAFGKNAMYSIISGNTNSSFGDGAGQSLTTGGANVGMGYSALGRATTGSSNVAIGGNAGSGITTGGSNTAIGASAMSGATTAAASRNVGIGGNALQYAAGNDNTAVGTYALYDQSMSGALNVGIGKSAGSSNTTGYNNVFLGAQSLGVPTGNNFVAIGSGALATKSNQVMLGGVSATLTDWNGAVTEVVPGLNNTATLGSSTNRWSVVYAATATINTSDGRVKGNQQTITNGLGTLLRLQPKTYFKHKSQFVNGSLVLEAGGAEEAGFIAQDVSGIIPTAVYRPEDDTKALWGMRYEQVLPYTVSAVQELKAENDALRAELDSMKGRMARLEELLSK